MKLDELNQVEIVKQLENAIKAEYLEGIVQMKQDPNVFEEMVTMFCEPGYNIPPFDRHALATRWWDPQVAADTIRELTFKQGLSEDEVAKRKFMEQYAPPAVYRINDDPKQLMFVYVDGKEAFAIELTYTKHGKYAPRSLR